MTLRILRFLTLFGLPLVVYAGDDASYRQEVGDYSVYLAVMPAEALRGPLQPYDPAANPNRPAAARDTHHVMVSIFESRGGRRVADVRVGARVAGLGFSGVKKTLDPISLVGGTVFGGYYPMIGRGPFRVDVEFGVPGKARPQHATFYFIHPRFIPRLGARAPAHRG